MGIQDPLNIAPSGVAVPVWMGNAGKPIQILIVNPDVSNTIAVGYRPNITLNAPNVVPLGPGQSVVMDGTNTIYVIGPVGTAPTILIPGGTSFFQPTTLNNIGGIQAFVQNTAPPGPHPVNSIWFQPTPGALFTWNGTVWVQQEFNANELITAGTIVATLIAAGTVVAGIVNGTTITGAQIIADGTSGQLLAYTGSPALHNLIAAITGADGNDTPGNQFFKGVGSYGATSGTAAYLTVDTSGQPWLVFRTGRPNENNFGNLQEVVRNSGAVNEQLIIHLQPPTISGQTDYPYIEIQSESKDGTIQPTGILAFSAEGTIAYWYIDGIHIPKKLWGTGGTLTIGDNVDLSGKVLSDYQVASPNITGYPILTQTANPDNTASGTSFSKLSSVWSVPANDANVGTAYRIKGYGFGFVQNTVMTLHINGFGAVLATLPIGAVAFPNAGQGFDFDFEAIVRIAITGVSGQASGSLSANFSVDSSNIAGGSGSQGSFGANRNAEGNPQTINTTINQNITVQASFSSVVAGQFIECTFDTFERLGP